MSISLFQNYAVFFYQLITFFYNSLKVCLWQNKGAYNRNTMDQHLQRTDQSKNYLFFDESFYLFNNLNLDKSGWPLPPDCAIVRCTLQPGEGGKEETRIQNVQNR